MILVFILDKQITPPMIMYVHPPGMVRGWTLTKICFPWWLRVDVSLFMSYQPLFLDADLCLCLEER